MKPATLDRGALERVLARAAELQAADGDSDEPGLSDAQLVEIAKEVGLAPANLRQALAEERSRIEAPAKRGAMDHVFGPAIARAMRTLRGAPAGHMEALDAWMQQQEGLSVKRRFPDRVLWERAPGIAANLKRAFDVGGRGYHLARATEVSATVIAVDADRTLVRLEASLERRRASNIGGGAALTVIGAAGSGTMLLLGIAPILAIFPIAWMAAIGYFVARSHSSAVARAQLALEQVLDRLEREDKPRQSLLDAIVTSARPQLRK